MLEGKKRGGISERFQDKFYKGYILDKSQILRGKMFQSLFKYDFFTMFVFIQNHLPLQVKI